MGTGQVIQRPQDLETVVVKQLDRALSKVQNGIATMLDWSDDVDWTGRQMDWQQGGMAQLELRDELLRWSHQAVV